MDFHDAIQIFAGRTVEWLDERFQYDQERWIAVGFSKDKEILIVYVEEEENLRHVISARKANHCEPGRYWREIGR